jgi:hypothetical protein
MSEARDPEHAEMAERLTCFLAADPEESLSRGLVRAVQDPLKPLTTEGRVRINPLLLILGAISFFAIGIFLFFSFYQP